MVTSTIHTVIDIGTNSILLLIARKITQNLNFKKSLVPLVDQAQIVRLGENLLSTGYLSDQAMARTLKGVTGYLKTVQSFSPSQILCFGTEALRRANNTDEFRQRLKQTVGLKFTFA